MIPKCLQRHFTCLHMHMQHNNNKSCKMQTDSIHTHAHSYSPTYTKTHIPLHIHSKRFHIIFHVYFCFSSDWIIVGKFPIIAWITCVLNRRHYSSTSVRLTLHSAHPPRRPAFLEVGRFVCCDACLWLQVRFDSIFFFYLNPYKIDEMLSSLTPLPLEWKRSQQLSSHKPMHVYEDTGSFLLILS